MSEDTEPELTIQWPDIDGRGLCAYTYGTVVFEEPRFEGVWRVATKSELRELYGTRWERFKWWLRELVEG